jgi:WD40 repeat protein
VKVWDAKSGQEVLTLRGHTGGVTSVCFSPDGKRLVSTSVAAAGNVVESTMRAVPPFVRIGCWASSRWLNEVGTGPAPTTLSAASGPGAFAWKMNSSFSGVPAKARSGTPKFLASTSRGVWASQSVSEKVSSSLKSPSSKTSRNSQPSPSRPWIECGMPDGKFHTPPRRRRPGRRGLPDRRR